MTLIEIGPKRFHVWVHNGADLRNCQALRLEHNFLRILFERMKRFKWKFGQQYMPDGRLRYHGEK
jgi:hypothetical protein